MRTLLTLLGLVITVSLAAQDKPLSQAELAKKPMYERLLKGEDAKKVAELYKQRNTAEAAGKVDEAIKLQEEVIAIRTRVQGADHWQVLNEQVTLKTLRSLDADGQRQRQIAFQANREGFQLNAKGRYAEAQPLYRKALDIRRQVLGEDHPSTALSYNNVAANLNAQGKAAEAQPLFQKALDIYRRVLGEDHPSTANSYNNVAYNLADQGKAAEAQPLYQKALNIRRKVLGEDHPDTALSYNNVAANLDDQGKAAEAQPLLQKALDITRKLLGEDHPDTAGSYNNVAMNLNAQGKAAEAQPLYQKALDIRRKVLGEDHPATAGSYNNVAFNLQAQGKAAEAQPLYQKALDIRRKVLGEDHPDTAGSYNNVAMNLNAQGKAAEAQPLFQKALDITRKLLGEDHPDTAQSYNNLAAILNAQGKAAEAQPLYQKALDIRRQVLGEDHPDTAQSYNNLAAILNAQGKAAEAQPLFQKALDIYRRVLGEDHPSTAVSYNNVAANLAAQGKAAEAQPLYRKALDIRRQVLGEDHPSTAQSYNNVAVNLIALNQPRRAVEVLTAAVPAFEGARQKAARGLERSNLTEFNPRIPLAILQAGPGPTAAWRNLEATLARGLFDQQSTATRLNTAERQRQQEARSRLAALQPRILNLVSRSARTAAEAQELEQLLQTRRTHEETMTRLAVADSERAIAPPEQIRQALAPDAAIIYWVDFADQSRSVQEHWGCVVRRAGEPHWQRLTGSGEKEKWTKEDSQLPGQLRDELSRTSPSLTTIEALAQKLHAQRIAPLLKHLDGVKTLYVVGVNEMAGLPVEVLAPDFAISYVPSGTFLARMPKKPKFDNTLLAVGDPIYEVKKANRVELTVLPSHGLLVQGLAPGGAAVKLGLQPGDVLLNYGDSKIEKLDQLRPAIQKAATSGDKTVSVAVWRVGEDNQAVEKTLQFPVGPLGVILAQEPAPVAIADRRKTEALFAKLNRGDEWIDLPGTRFEVARISQLFPSAKVLVDGQASERGVDALRISGELGKFRYLHFATHGKGNNVTAFESKLILSQDQPKELIAKPGEPWYNNEISAREVLDFWKLNADLVTLSACQTGLGKSGSGDGLLGFAQAFLLSGARSVCLSLWEVDDTATALLMQRFYQNLLGQRPGLSAPMSKQLALKEAKDWLRNLTNVQATELTASLMNGVSRGTRGEIKVPKRIKADAPPESKPYANPHYWSAFILIGDPE